MNKTSRELVCIVCPNGCEMKIEYAGKELLSCCGNTCEKGLRYASDEISDPKRSLTGVVKVTGGTFPLTSVRLTRQIPRERLFDVMAELKKITIQAPVRRGQIICRNILGFGADVMVTGTLLRTEGHSSGQKKRP